MAAAGRYNNGDEWQRTETRVRVVGARAHRTLHLFTYVVGNALVWILWGAITISTDNWYWWPLVPLAGWTLVLALRLWHVYPADMAPAGTEPAIRADRGSDA